MNPFRIVNLRGTSGSGKSHVAHQLLKRFPWVPAGLDAKGRPLGYQLTLPNGKPLYIVGRYTTQCGGCDGIGSTAEVMRRVDGYALNGHVFFEGLLISGGYGAMGKWSEKFRDRFIFATLSTPLELCLSRVTARRLKRGKTEPLNPKNTTQKYRAVFNTHAKTLALGRNTVMVDHRHAVREVLEMLGARRP